MAEFMELDGLACDPEVERAEVERAIERWKGRLDLSDEQRSRGLDAVMGTMEWRSPGHLADKR